MSSPNQLFPQNPSDPFCQEIAKDNSDLSSSWPDHSHSVPKWRILTTQEEKEQSETINKLEAKIAQIKSRSDRYYTQQKTYSQVDAAYLDSDNESDNSLENSNLQAEEGLPLLWKTKAVPLETIQKKSDQHYTKRSFFYCCSC